eukprot:1153263-Pelagomonas_calceolata.AAC.5
MQQVIPSSNTATTYEALLHAEERRTACKFTSQLWVPGRAGVHAGVWRIEKGAGWHPYCPGKGSERRWGWGVRGVQCTISSSLPEKVSTLPPKTSTFAEKLAHGGAVCGFETVLRPFGRKSSCSSLHQITSAPGLQLLGWPSHAMMSDFTGDTGGAC